MESWFDRARASNTVESTGNLATAVVTDNDDQHGLGRVRVRFPWSGENSAWAPVMTPMAGNDRGLYCLPEVGDRVVVMFDRGDIDSPIVIGALWNGKDKPPVPSGKGKSDVRIFKSRSGHTITLDDSAGKEQISIVDKTGNNKIVLDANGNQITIHAAQSLSLTSDNSIEINAKTMLKLNGKVVRINDDALEVT